MWLARVAPIGLAAALIAGATAGTVAAAPWQSAEHWDPRLVPLVAFIERTRGLHFKHPVPARFFDRRAWHDAMVGNDYQTEQYVRAVQNRPFDIDAVHRAEGLVDGTVKETTYQINRSDNDIIGVYRFATKDVIINSERLGSAESAKLTLNVRATLVHELTHALDDQYYVLGSLPSSPGESLARTALIEGDARRVEDRYYQTQAPDDLPATSGAASSPPSIDTLRAQRLLDEAADAPYALGPLFLDELVNEKGLGAVDEAFKRPPRTEAEILDVARYLRDEAPGEVPPPPMPAGAKNRIDFGGYGMFSMFLTLSNRIGYDQARQAITGWAGDHEIGYQLDGRQCVSVASRADSEAGAASLLAAASAWVAQGPSGAARADRQADTVTMEMCDPGTSYRMPVLHGLAPYDILTNERYIVGHLGGTTTEVQCYAAGLQSDPFVRQLTYPYEANSGALQAAAREALQALGRKCLS